jgi:hypothetical protein
MAQELLTVGEFDRRMTSVENMIARGFEQNAVRIDDHGERIAALETAKTMTRGSTAGWSTAVAGGVVAAFEAIKLVVGK